MSLYHGLFVRATSTPDLYVNCSEGLMEMPSTGATKYIAETATLCTVATSGKEKVGILQVTQSSGALAMKYGDEVAAASGLAQYPAPDSGKLVLALIGTAAAPITNSTTAITNAMISNKVQDSETGGR